MIELINKLVEERNKKRDKIQSHIVEDWVSNGRVGTYIASMGLGKGKIIADSISSVLEDTEAFLNIRDKSIPILVQVSSEYLRDVDTVNELIRWGIPTDLFRDGFIKLVCYQTSSRWKTDKDIGLLVSDEVDFAISEKYGRVFQIQNPLYSLALTGTFIEEKEELSEELKYFPPVRFRYPIQQAQEDGIINKTKIIIHEVPLSAEKNIRVDYIDKNTKKPNHFFTSEVEQYLYIEKQILIATIQLNNAYNASRDGKRSMEERATASLSIPKLTNRLKYLQFSAGNKNSRTNITYNLQSLSDYTLKLKNTALEDERINISNDLAKPNKVIIFGKFTDLIDKLTPYGFHGKKTKEEGEEIINKFNFGEIREVGVIQKANRGINFTDLNICIAYTFPGALTYYLQGIKGRMTRLPIYRNAYVHVLYSYYYKTEKSGKVSKVYCQNKVWADSFLEGESNDIYVVNSIEESVQLISKLEQESLNKVINENNK